MKQINNDNKYYTYKLISSINGEVFYIGKGSGDRCQRHLKIAIGKSKSKSKNPKLYNKINDILSKEGEIIIEKVLETNIEKDALDMEVYLINEIGIENLCNLTLGGEGTSYPNGFSDKHKFNISQSKLNNHWVKYKIFTDDEKKVISERVKELYRIGKLVPYFKGKNHTKETNDKMSKSHLNKEFSITHKENLSKSLSGRKLTDEHKKNLSQSHKNNYNYFYLEYNKCKEWVNMNYPNIKSKQDWFDLDRSGLPEYIPRSPDWVYKRSNHYSGWISWKHFLNK